MTSPDTAEYVTFAPEAFTEQGTLTPAMRDYLASLLAQTRPATEAKMWDYNVWHTDGLDVWTDDLATARQWAAEHLASEGQAATITRYPMRETPNGWETDTLAGGEVIA